ncbi:MAG: preprotein translocase subunit SecG [Gammaproteobacteria bacterium]|nr:preprotein translocase subunit SecG [Gammaproteobacteria bacterium]
MQSILMVAHLLMAFALIGFILLQQGRGADTGAAFGSGASTTVFGARGSATFLSRATAVLAILFFANSLLLAHLSSRRVESRSLMEDVVVESPVAPAPAVPADVPSIPGRDADVPVAPAP